jgi:hypothetical protein
MPFQLRFSIEDRNGVMVLIDHNSGNVRPATSSEVELWNALTSKISPTRETFVKVSEQDMVVLLMERDYLKKQFEELTKKYDLLCKSKESKE